MNILIRTIKSGIILALVGVFFFMAHDSVAATRRISREEYIRKYKDIAIAHQRRYGIPASITMAQGILESDSGNSLLSRGSNNHFGIKCKSHWKGRTFTYSDDAPNECFRAYKTVEESYADHAEFLESSPRYDFLFSYSATDYRKWAYGLKKAGYATAKDYPQRLIKIIEDNKLNLLDSKAGQRRYDSVNKGSDALIAAAIAPAMGSSERAMAEVKKVDPNRYRVSVSSYNGYNLYRTNKCLYTVAKSGDSFKSLAKNFEISRSAIRSYNEKKRGEPSANEIIYLERKGSKWRGNTRTHEVQRGETMHGISQSYGIKEKSLRRMNKIDMGEPVEGFKIKLR